jgi:hypothetical protein
MGCNWKKVRDEAGALSLRQLLTESLAWLEIENKTPSRSWSGMLPEIEKVVHDLEDRIDHLESHPTSKDHNKAKARLVDFCSRVRCFHNEQPPPAP